MGIVIGIDVGGSTTKSLESMENRYSLQCLLRLPTRWLPYSEHSVSIFMTMVYSWPMWSRWCWREWEAHLSTALYMDCLLANGWVYCQWFGSQTCNGYRPTDCSQHGYRHFFCEIDGDKVQHIGGLGIGGGTLQGLSRLLLKLMIFIRCPSWLRKGM